VLVRVRSTIRQNEDTSKREREQLGCFPWWEAGLAPRHQRRCPDLKSCQAGQSALRHAVLTSLSPPQKLTECNHCLAGWHSGQTRRSISLPGKLHLNFRNSRNLKSHPLFVRPVFEFAQDRKPYCSPIKTTPGLDEQLAFPLFGLGSHFQFELIKLPWMIR